MAMEAIQKVTQIELETAQRREAAAAESKQKLLVAQRAAQRVLEDARVETDAEVRQMMAEAEAEAARMAQVVMEQARQESEEMKRAARQKLEQAAELIVEKVVRR